MPRAKPRSVAAQPPLGNGSDARVEWLQLDRQLCFALYASSLAMTKLYKPLLAPLGLTYPQYLALLALWEAHDRAQRLSVGLLGQRLSLDSGTLTPLLKRLEQSGLIERRRAPDDERRVDLWLTPAGVAKRDEALDIPACLAKASDCGPAELLSLTQRLHQLRERLRPSSTSASSGGLSANLTHP